MSLRTGSDALRGITAYFEVRQSSTLPTCQALKLASTQPQVPQAQIFGSFLQLGQDRGYCLPSFFWIMRDLRMVQFLSREYIVLEMHELASCTLVRCERCTRLEKGYEGRDGRLGSRGDQRFDLVLVSTGHAWERCHLRAPMLLVRCSARCRDCSLLIQLVFE